jgi:hypothetical protein
MRRWGIIRGRGEEGAKREREVEQYPFQNRWSKCSGWYIISIALSSSVAVDQYQTQV